MTTPAWSQIEALVNNVHGWTPIDQLFALYTLTLATAGLSGDIVEVGSWCGRSAVVLASAARSTGGAKVHCVDLFPARDDWKQNPDGTYSFDMVIDGKRYVGYQEQTVWKEAFESQTSKIYETYDSVYDCFRETVAARGLDDVVMAHRGDLGSLLAKRGPDFQCRLAFLDGDHGYEAVREDIQNIDRHLVPGGWLCFDDAFTVYDGVSRAISELVIDNPEYEHCQQMTRKLFVARKKATGTAQTKVGGISHE
ncbi:MAG: class I SAM-dependent methyltransferase [Rhodocyclaceae bacterium]